MLIKLEMVVIEAAAITAGSIAAYKGGKAAVTASAKSIKTKIHSHKQEKSRTETFNSRKEERAERFAKINQYRESMQDVNKREGVLKSFQWGSKEGGSSRGAGAASTRSSLASGRPVSSSAPSGKKPFSSSKSWRS